METLRRISNSPGRVGFAPTEKIGCSCLASAALSVRLTRMVRMSAGMSWKFHFAASTNSNVRLSGKALVPRTGNAVFAVKSGTASYSVSSLCSNENG